MQGGQRPVTSSSPRAFAVVVGIRPQTREPVAPLIAGHRAGSEEGTPLQKATRHVTVPLSIAPFSTLVGYVRLRTSSWTESPEDWMPGTLTMCH